MHARPRTISAPLTALLAAVLVMTGSASAYAAPV